MIKQASVFYTLISCCFLMSCSDVPQQYQGKLQKSNPNRVMDTRLDIPVHPTNQLGGQLWNEKKELSEEEEKEKIRANSLSPIIYQSGSIGNIDLNTKHNEARDVLHKEYQSGTRVFYKENISVFWRESPPRIPEFIIAGFGYQGNLDFGPKIGKRSIGESFEDQFSAGVRDILEDQKAVTFITELFQFLEDSEENCLETKNCSLSINPQGTLIAFGLPKMTLLFGNNARRQLIQVAVYRNESPGCFKQPFDMLNTQFTCELSEEGSPIQIQLGDPFPEVIQKSGIDPHLPVSHGYNTLLQIVRTGTLGWKRINLEEKEETVSKDSYLSSVDMGANYTLPFLMDTSLIKVTFGDSNNLQINLEPIENEDDQRVTAEHILKKVTQTESENSFYLSTQMPQLSQKYTLQRNLMIGLLDFIEDNYSQNYLDQNIKFRIYKRVYGTYDDTSSPDVSGRLLVVFEDPKAKILSIDIRLLGSSGYMRISFGFIENSLVEYFIKNQGDIHLRKDDKGISGFFINGRIYLRHKDLGDKSAIASFIYSKDKGKEEILTPSLVGYNDEREMSVIYESGVDRNITYERTEFVSMPGVSLYVNPTDNNKDIQGESYDEYVIEGISADDSVFYGSLRGLCQVEGSDVQMGISDSDFSEILFGIVDHINLESSTRGRRSNLTNNQELECPYMAPQDPSFSGLKGLYFFPKHKLVLWFSNRELSRIRIYKDPNQSLKVNE